MEQAGKLRTGYRAAKAGRIAMAALAVVLAAGCNSTRQQTGTNSTAAARAFVQPGSAEAMREVSAWASAYQRSPDDRQVIIGYANALRRNGQIEQSMAVLRNAIIKHGSDRDIASAYGKILAMNGNLQEALNVLQNAQTPATPDWRLLSAEGAVHDQMGNPQRARALYNQALKIVPEEPTVLNNLGLSFLLAGQAPDAEYYLRRAAASPRADSRIRQNLALALGLQGKFAEAQQVALNELDPQQAEANIAYLRAILAAQSPRQGKPQRQG
ncbi:tetratricopeptide repeat protein [Pannonibacter phragmitetus]|uniref:tetratricopeptide repeat protein n=2 Tax=Pannonibacter phragmitetus TaxID=121719 RepID=UPI000A70C393|nr:tetratricopeptide repeat protein [Pannonibacter phragmitetus]